MDFKIYHVREANVGQPLSAMLRRVLGGTSWGDVKKLVLNRRVQINGNLCTDETRRLRAGEIVRIAQESLAKPAEAEQIVVRLQDEHLMVVEKPAGVTTLRHAEERDWDDKRKNRQPTLDEMLQKIVDHGGQKRIAGGGVTKTPRGKKQLNPAAHRGKKYVKVRAVHRLDRDTSGLMVFALSPQAEQELVRGFAKHAYTRAYLAVVEGRIDSPRTIETNLVRDRGDGLRGSLPQGETREDAKPAITHIKPVRQIGDYTLIECRLETGRTHQIRIHLSEIGHRLCGENTYVRPLGGEAAPDVSGAPRHVLHAHRLSLTHPVGGQTLNFETKLPRDLQRWLNRLEQAHTPDA